MVKFMICDNGLGVLLFLVKMMKFCGLVMLDFFFLFYKFIVYYLVSDEFVKNDKVVIIVIYFYGVKEIEEVIVEFNIKGIDVDFIEFMCMKFVDWKII